MEGDQGSLTRAEIATRTQRFASLRAAQRALSDLAHVSDLEAMMAQGGELLVQLQALNSRAPQVEGAALSPEENAADLEALRSVDRLLDEMSARTGAALDRISISQLRLTLKERASEHREEVRGVIDVILDGDVENESRLTMLEFLVTLLSSEHHDSGRRVARELNDVAPRLAVLAARFIGEDDPETLAAEKAFVEARANLLEPGAVGPTRDRLRRYKRQLGARILHPRVMSAVVHYNVAMANRVAGLVENNRSLDTLADDLLVSPAVEESAAPASSSSSVFDSAGFSRIVSALQARLLEGPCSDAVAAHIVDGYELGSLLPAEIEAFEPRDEDPIAHLVRTSTALALTVRHETACTPELRELGIDPTHLRHDWRRELSREMGARAQKLLAETRYVEASTLSGLRAKNLAAAPTVPREPARRDRSSRTPTRQPSAPESRLGLGSRLPRLLMAGAGLVVLALLLSSLGGGTERFSRDDILDISPFLESGHLVEMADTTRFVGKLNRGWQYLETPDRAAVAAEIGEYFQESGVESVALTRDGREEARFRGGAVVHVTPRPSAPPTP